MLKFERWAATRAPVGAYNQFLGGEKMTPVHALLSSTWPSYSGSKCIDGVTEGSWQNVCNSKFESAPWLALDYGKEVSVQKVVLYNRRDRPWAGARVWARTKNVQIRLSNELPSSGKEMFLGGEALGSFKGPATRGQKVEIQSGPGWERKTGRYLIIQMNFGNAHNLLNLKEAYAVGISHVAPSKGGRTCYINASFLQIQNPVTMQRTYITINF